MEAVLVYDSQFWQPVNGAWTPEAGGGWWLRTSAGHLNETTTVNFGACGWTDGSGTDDGSGTITNYAFTFDEPDGTAAYGGSYISVNAPNRIHPEGYYNDCPPSDTLPISTFIGDGKGYHVVIDSSGAGTAWDGNGDNLTDGLADPNGNSVTVSAGTLRDPLGTALTISGSGTPSSPIVYTYTGTGATPVSVTELFESVYATGGFGCYTGWSGYLNLPEAITYPDGSEYVFSYDSAGRLATLTLPTGGVVSYSQSLSNNCSYTASSLTRSQSLDSGKQWLWSNSSDSSSGQTAETSPDNNITVFDFDGTGALAEADAYNGPYTTGASEISKTTIATGYSGGTTKTAVTELFGPTPLYSQHEQTFDAYDHVTASSDTDWGTTSPGGATLRETAAVYGASGEAEVLTSQTVSDGAGAEVSKSTYSYDSRANLLSENDYATNGASLAKSYSYNSNGTVHQATDANGAVTTYGYTCGSGIFPNSAQSAVALVATSATWDCTGGVELSSTDPNGQTTIAAYGDPTHMWRPTSVTTPDGSQTTIGYISPNQVERAMTFNSNASTSDALITLDALGRPVLSQRRQGPGSANFDTVETGYDAMDRAVSVSMPFTAAAGAGGGTVFTTTTYDALSRPLVVTDGGGGTVGYAYNENDVLTTVGPAPAGENTKRKQEEFDGLGRLRSVCEINALGGDGACGQTVAQSGYLTQYARNGIGQITQVTQNAQTTPTQSRSFSFDQLGRLTAETNPESGTTAYTFDSDSTCGTSQGDLVKRLDANGNTTCYAYDYLHRVTQISYKSGPNTNGMLTKHFVYDAATVDGTAMANVAGKLAEAYTGSRHTDLGFSYPNPGADEEDVYQLSPNSGGWYVSIAQHYPNGAPSELTMPGAVPAIQFGLDGAGRVNYAAAGSASLAYNGVYSTLGLTGVTLGSGDGDSYSYDSATGRMTQYQFTVNGVSDTGALAWNANGSLGTLAVADNIPGTSDSQTCGYTHDDLGRIASVACTGGDNWSQAFSYDSLGNVLKSGTQSFQPNYGINNRISTNIGFAPNYDNDGDLLATR